MKTACLMPLIAWACTLPTEAAEPLRVLAAGSLKGVFVELAQAFEASSGVPLRLDFGPSGLLRDRLLKGEAADVFASANMEHPQQLHDRGMAAPVRRFARNRLCALVGPELDVTPENLLERLLDPAVKLGTSTPKADPSGDYAFALFARADRRQPGAGERLTAKALQLTGGPNSPPPPQDRSQYGLLVENGSADIFITYCTNAWQARKEVPTLQVVNIADDINVAADYGLAVIGKSTAASDFADYVLSPAGQALLGQHGFSAASNN